MRFWHTKWAFGIEWGPGHHQYIQFFNYLPRVVRYWGFDEDYYDGPLPSFGFWFFNVAWRF